MVADAPPAGKIAKHAQPTQSSDRQTTATWPQAARPATAQPVPNCPVTDQLPPSYRPVTAQLLPTALLPRSFPRMPPATAELTLSYDRLACRPATAAKMPSKIPLTAKRPPGYRLASAQLMSS